MSGRMMEADRGNLNHCGDTDNMNIDNIIEETEQNEASEKGLEERFASIEAVLGRMEDTDVTLEESFSLYRQGLAELAAADAMLDEIEKAMLVMNEDGELEEFV